MYLFKSTLRSILNIMFTVKYSARNDFVSIKDKPRLKLILQRYMNIESKHIAIKKLIKMKLSKKRLIFYVTGCSKHHTSSYRKYLVLII